ncbi:hypothetical protein SEA_ANNADREAMY_4 [Streptomyces phage Annadreamy]|uniref:Uncharacterized protein n=2 Tax=Annadreamyvirus annadreamy TaxID=2846392 RepID=A0A345GT56_9CAUD|nr:hypothetical protein HWB75_gp004 [Streptomyces phage Annadreamy]AXG66128.1 hypothetical protein SEA_ANNADREAMY_4 [Streptomyces phage Annadreamy]QGH79340.1 hypothetical protein SEA_LIMPID_4 [Streptomyces phage Limpid]
MATQKEVLESLGTEDELLYWAKKNKIELEDFPGGYFVDEWQVTIHNNTIMLVERRLDEPQSA